MLRVIKKYVTIVITKRDFPKFLKKSIINEDLLNNFKYFCYLLTLIFLGACGSKIVYRAGPAHVNKRDIVFFALLPNNLID